MAKRSKKQARRLRNLVMICTICAVVLTVSTYAWFIGMKTVNVSTFDIDIAVTEGLYLSMDGENWSYNLNAADESLAYEGNTNTWAKDGLIPMSTVGDLDSDASRMKLFEKASLTTTPGGYRLLTSRVENYATSADDGKIMQGDGYVAFDLFIKNLSGAHYYTEMDPLNEEAIYLTTNSKVEVARGGIENTGIENSVRVAFAQIGRVSAEEKTISNITGITCNGGGTVTGICRDAQIWEPNDKDHVQNAINWYNTSCSLRKAEGTDVTKKESYTFIEKTDENPTNCGTVANGTAYSTYAVSKAITIGDNVDVYDGDDYNTYTKNSIDYETYVKDKNNHRLVDFPYFTDTMKDKKGTDRPTFMTLAPNSITKVRVYVYIEGQDVDNYDYASLGAKISVNFGFTKERFTGVDIDYNDKNTATLPDDVVGTKSDDAVGTPEE